MQNIGNCIPNKAGVLDGLRERLIHVYTGFNSLTGYQTDFKTLRLDRICEKTRNVPEIRRELAKQIKLWKTRHNHIDSQILMLKIRMLKWVLNHDNNRF